MVNGDKENAMAEAMYESAAAVAADHFADAMEKAGAAASFIPLAMIEIGVSTAVEEHGHEGVIQMLEDLIEQIAADAEDDGDEDEDEE